MIDALRAGKPASVRDAIAQAAGSTGVDFRYLLAQAKSESGLDPGARAASSSAAGLFQFIDQSWLGVLKKHGAEHGLGWAADRIEQRNGRWRVTDADARRTILGLREDPGASALMAGAFASDNAAGLAQALGRAPSGTDLYFAHFLGLKGATRFLQAADAAPEASAAALFPHEATANRAIFYDKAGAARSLSQVYALMGRKLDGAAAGEPVELAAAEPAAGTGSDDPPADAATAATLALHQTPDLLRPDPKHAMLAYRLIAASLA